MTAFTPGDFDGTRNYFPGCEVALPKFELLVGPLSPTPNRSAVEIVAEYALAVAA